MEVFQEKLSSLRYYNRALSGVEIASIIIIQDQT